MELATQQAAALDAIQEWWEEGESETVTRGQVFRLFGYAGTGKTTIAKLVPQVLDLVGRVRFAAYTGKAAHVLARKGCAPVSTIHSLIYQPIEVMEPCGAGLACPDRDPDLNRCGHEVKRLEFVRKESLDPEYEPEWDEDGNGFIVQPSTVLIILDEVSMVDQALAADLLSFGVRVLVLGDPAQLPPISGTGFFTQAEPDFMLTEVHRQAAESPVLRLATLVREGGRAGSSARPSMSDLAAAGQVLCWRNATRWSVVHTMRGALGRPGGVPVAGDRVMCLANNRGLGVFNGQQFWVAGVQEGPTRFGTWRLTLVDDEPRVYQLEVMGAGFVDQKGEEEVRRNGSRGTWAAMTFANAITVHKAQGSEWDSVIVIDESAGLEAMTSKRGEDGAAARRTWLYTAITRASREVVLADARGW